MPLGRKLPATSAAPGFFVFQQLFGVILSPPLPALLAALREQEMLIGEYLQCSAAGGEMALPHQDLQTGHAGKLVTV